MKTAAEREGDEQVPNGRKQWTTIAPYADFAQVFARTTPGEEGQAVPVITCFLVEDDEFEVASISRAVGMRGMEGELRFNDVRLPESLVPGEPDSAFYSTMEFLSQGRLGVADIAVGHMETLPERATEYANEREAFGRPVGQFQGIFHRIAESNPFVDHLNLARTLRVVEGIDEIHTVGHGPSKQRFTIRPLEATRSPLARPSAHVLMTDSIN